MKVVLDIETVQATRDEWARLCGKPPANEGSYPAEGGFDLFAIGAAEEQRRAEDESYAKSAFDATFSRIVCIGLLEFSDQMEARSAVAWFGTNERELLRQFWARLAQDRPTLFITHNGPRHLVVLGHKTTGEEIHMHTHFTFRGFLYIGALMSLSLVLAGCSMFSGEAKIHKNAKGFIYLKEIADWSFEASHPAAIDQITMLKIVKGVVADDVQKMPGNMPASGSKPMRVFSDEDAEFLAPLLAQGLSQAKPEQIVGFKVSPSAGSGTEPTAGTLYMHKGSIYLTIAPSQNRKASGFTPSSAARLEKAPSFVALGNGAMTMVIDYQALAKGPTSPSAAGTSKLIPASASQAVPMAPAVAPTLSTSVTETTSSQETSIFLAPQEFAAHSRTDSGTSQLSSEELLNRKLDELRQAREANKLKDSEIAMLKKEAAWIKQELRQRAEEVKAMKASKTAARSAPKKKSAEAYPTR